MAGQLQHRPPGSPAQQALAGSASPNVRQAGASPGTQALLSPSTMPRALCCHQGSATPRGSRHSSPAAAGHAHTAQPCNAKVLVFIEAGKSSPWPKDTGAGSTGLQPSSTQQEQLPLLLSPQLGTAQARRAGHSRTWAQQTEASGMFCSAISGFQNQRLKVEKKEADQLVKCPWHCVPLPCNAQVCCSSPRLRAGEVQSSVQAAWTWAISVLAALAPAILQHLDHVLSGQGMFLSLMAWANPLQSLNEPPGTGGDWLTRGCCSPTQSSSKMHKGFFLPSWASLPQGIDRKSCGRYS